MLGYSDRGYRADLRSCITLAGLVSTLRAQNAVRANSNSGALGAYGWSRIGSGLCVHFPVLLRQCEPLVGFGGRRYVLCDGVAIAAGCAWGSREPQPAGFVRGVRGVDSEAGGVPGARRASPGANCGIRGRSA